CLVKTHPFLRGQTGSELYPADPGADAAVGPDQRQPDLAGALQVGSATELPGPVPKGDHPDSVAVLLVEEGHRPAGHRLVERELLDPPLQVGPDPRVEQSGNPLDLLGGERPGKAKV